MRLIMMLVKKIFEKHVLFRYTIRAFLKTLLVFVVFFSVVFFVLKISGKYTVIANMLDLKYYSPWIIGPLLIAAALAVLSFIVGMILYLYKYKRNKYKSDFYKALTGVLNGDKKYD